MPLDNPANCSATASSPAEWLLPGLIPKNQVTLLSGDDGRLVMDMCMVLATGKPFWGFPATPKVPILFVTTERKNKVHHRAHACMKSKGLLDNTFADVQLDFMPLPGSGVNPLLCIPGPNKVLVKGPFYDLLCAKMAMMPRGALLILDTICAFWAGDANNPSRVTEFVRGCLGSLIRGYGCTILAVNWTWTGPDAPYPDLKPFYDAFPNQLWVEPDAAQRTWFYEGKRRAAVPGEHPATQLEWKEGIIVPVREAA